MGFIYARRLFLLTLVLSISLANAVNAKDLMRKGDGMNAQLFRPAVDTKGHFSVDSTPILPHLAFSLGMILDFGFNCNYPSLGANAT